MATATDTIGDRNLDRVVVVHPRHNGINRRWTKAIVSLPLLLAMNPHPMAIYLCIAGPTAQCLREVGRASFSLDRMFPYYRGSQLRWLVAGVAPPDRSKKIDSITFRIMTRWSSMNSADHSLEKSRTGTTPNPPQYPYTTKKENEGIKCI